jgi:hypothetical protein
MRNPQYKDTYYGRIYIDKKYDNMLADYGVIMLSEYNEKLGCFEDCIMSRITNDKLLQLAHDNILAFDGIIVRGLEKLQETLNEGLRY